MSSRTHKLRFFATRSHYLLRFVTLRYFVLQRTDCAQSRWQTRLSPEELSALDSAVCSDIADSAHDLSNNRIGMFVAVDRIATHRLL